MKTPLSKNVGKASKMRYQMDSQNAGELESSAYVALDRCPDTNPSIFVDCSVEPSLTRQEFAAECDINSLMSQFEKTGILPTNLATQPPRYLDVSDVPDLPTALNMLNDATAAFMALPAIVRRDFDNDPVKFIHFAENPDNVEKMRSWGLAPPAPLPPEPTIVRVVADPVIPEPEPKSAPKK